MLPVLLMLEVAGRALLASYAPFIGFGATICLAEVFCPIEIGFYSLALLLEFDLTEIGAI